MDPALPTVDVRLWVADAVVLLDWLSAVDLDAVPISHPAQKQALMDLLTQLEQAPDVSNASAEGVAAAQEQVAADMGW